RRLLVSASNMQQGSRRTEQGMSAASGNNGRRTTDNGRPEHEAAPAHASTQNPLIPLSAMADVRIVEGPAMIKSENGRLLNYVTLNVRGRDIVGFVDEAQRVVAQKVSLPEGVHLEWSG